MRIKKLLSLSILAAALGLTSAARAESPRLAAVRDGLQELDARAKAVRARAEQAPPPVRQESERIVDTVDGQRVFLATRLDLFDMVGRSDSVDEDTVQEIEAKLSSAERLLSLVESWFRPR